MRMGIDDDHQTYLDAGRIAEQSGIAAVALHARTAAQAYSGQADWSAVARLKEHVTTVPVLPFPIPRALAMARLLVHIARKTCRGNG